MAIYNLQTLVRTVANVSGVVVTGTCKESMRADGNLRTPSFSLPSLSPLAGPFPNGANPDDNQGVLRAGRSACELGVVPGVETSSAYHRERQAMMQIMPAGWSMANPTRG